VTGGGGTFELPNPTLARAGEELIAMGVPVTRALGVGEKVERHNSLMCGGRGIRPTSLSRTLRLDPGGQVRHAGGDSALCWRLVTADPVADVDRVPVDAHGWPPHVAIPDE